MQRARANIAAVTAAVHGLKGSLAHIDSNLLEESRRRTGRVSALGLKPTLRTGINVAADGTVMVDISAHIVPQVVTAIQALGGHIINAVPRFNRIHARVPISAVEALAALPGVGFVQPFTRPMYSVDSEGDVTHNALLSRGNFKCDGTGVKVAVISDSVNYLAEAQASGALGAVTVLPGQSGRGIGDDTGEGTAMLDIVHDLAPNAQLYFATADNGEEQTAQNILDLRAAGCDIICDDVTFLDETPFQDGPIAVAVKQITTDGGLYFSAAANSGNLDAMSSGTWQGDFVSAGPSGSPLVPGQTLNFGGGGNADTVYNDAGEGLATLYWADPQIGASDDYNLFAIDPDTGEIDGESVNVQDGGTTPPFEIAPYYSGDVLAVTLVSGSPCYLHLDTNRGQLLNAYSEGSIRGHNGCESAVTVAATDANNSYPNAFVGGTTNPVEYFSSDGAVHIFFNADGSAITPGNSTSSGGRIYNKPDLTAADGVSTSLAQGGELNPFYGTSAATPHAAAIAALVKSYNPFLTSSQIRTIMDQSTLDTGATGYDRDSGYGIVMADLCLGHAPPPESISVQGVSVSKPLSGSVPANFMVSLTTPAQSAISVNYVTSDGTAVAGTDYSATSGTVTFAVGQTTATVAVPVLSSPAFGANKTFNLTLSAPVGASLVTAQAVGTIVEPLAPRATVKSITPTGGTSYVLNPYLITETCTDLAGPSDITTVQVDVGPNSSGGNSLFAYYDAKANLLYLRDTTNTTWLGGYAPGSNHTITNGAGSLNCATTQVSSGKNLLTIAWSFTPATSFVGQYNVYGSVSDTSGETGGLQPFANWTIATLPTVSVSDVGISVPGTGTRIVQFAVLLNQASTLPTSVGFATADGTAHAGTDYVATSGTLKFAAGQRLGYVPVVVNGITSDNSGLVFSLVLSSPSQVQLGRASAICTITHDRSPSLGGATPLPQLSNINTATRISSSYTDPDGGADLQVVEIAAGKLGSPGTCLTALYYPATNLLYLTGPDGKLAGGYAPGSVNTIITTLGSLDCSRTTVVAIANGYQVTWNLTPLPGLAGVQPVLTQVYDREGESPSWTNFGNWSVYAPPSIGIGNASIRIGTSGSRVLQFPVTVTGKSVLPVVVRYATFDGTAISGQDYTSTSGLLTIPAGGISASIPVTVFGNDGSRGTLNFLLQLSGAVHSSVTPFPAQGSIIPDALPKSVSVTPLSQSVAASGQVKLVATYSDGDGTADLNIVELAVGKLGSAGTALTVIYYPASNKLYLVGPSGQLVGGFAPGSANVITTSLGALDCASASTSTGQAGLQLTVKLTVNSGLKGTNPVLANAYDVPGLSSQWTTFGTVTVTVGAAGSAIAASSGHTN